MDFSLREEMKKSNKKSSNQKEDQKDLENDENGEKKEEKDLMIYYDNDISSLSFEPTNKLKRQWKLLKKGFRFFEKER